MQKQALINTLKSGSATPNQTKKAANYLNQLETALFELLESEPKAASMTQEELEEIIKEAPDPIIQKQAKAVLKAKKILENNEV